jgi:hypothetical protein
MNPQVSNLNPIIDSDVYQEGFIENGISYDPHKLIKQGIWLYFFLLIFEGALRKWFLPGLSTPLLIIRDPIALWLILVTWKKGLLPSNIFLTSIMALGILGFVTACLFGHKNIPVALYGSRIFLIHIPLIFVIGNVFSKEDVEKMGTIVLWLAIPMAVLIAMQFYSPQSAWVNRGVGGDLEGAGFGGAMGFFRPPGTFSFTNGTSLFFSFAAIFIFYFWINRSGVSQILLLGATAALIVAIPLSISRGLLFQVAASAFFTIIAVMRKPQYFGRIIFAGIIGLVVLAIVSNISFFETASEAFTSRFDDATTSEGGLEGVFIDRFLGGMVAALSESTQHPFWGYGIGMGTNVGSMLLTGTATFLIAEGEWARIIGEQGPFLGVGVIVFRILLITRIGLACFKSLTKGNIFPWILLSFGFFNILQGQWAQPTSLGFTTLIGGLMIASMKTTPKKANVNY